MIKDTVGAMKEAMTPQVIASAIVIIIAVVLIILFNILLSKIKKKRAEVGTGLGHFASDSMAMGVGTTIGQFIFVVIIIMILMGINGVNITSAIAGLGLAGAAGAVSIKDLIGDIIMGIRIINDKFFKVGDVVQYKNRQGKVILFNLKTTKIEDILNHDIISICNRNITDITVVSTQEDVDITLSYDLPMKETYAFFKDVCKEIRTISEVETCIFKGTQQFSTDGVVYKIRIYVNYAENKPDTVRMANKIIQQHLEDAGYRIPYSQMDIHTY